MCVCKYFKTKVMPDNRHDNTPKVIGYLIKH